MSIDRFYPPGTTPRMIAEGAEPLPDSGRCDRAAIGDEIRAILRAHKIDHAQAVYQIGEFAERLGSTRPLYEIPEWEPPLPCDECGAIGGHKAWCGT